MAACPEEVNPQKKMRPKLALDPLTVTIIYFGIAIVVGYCVVRAIRGVKNPFIQLTVLLVSAVALWYFLIIYLLPQFGLPSL
jgi:hypothetical protein